MKKRLSVGGGILIGVAVVLIIVLLASFTNGLTDWSKDTIIDSFSRDLNEDNCYNADCVTLTDSNLGNGIVVDVDDKTGVIKISGTSSSDYTYEVGNVTLDAGKYTLTAIDGAALNSIYMTLTVGSVTYNFDFTPGNVIEIAADDTVCSLAIVVKADAEIDHVAYPVINPGDEAGKFYA